MDDSIIEMSFSVPLQLVGLSFDISVYCHSVKQAERTLNNSIMQKRHCSVTGKFKVGIPPQSKLLI